MSEKSNVWLTVLKIQLFVVCLNVLIAMFPLRNVVPIYAGY